MKKIVIIMLISLILPTACNTGRKTNAEKTSTADDGIDSTFQYKVDRFADIEILRYPVPGFNALSLQQKELIYYLSQAALEGRDILYDQHNKYNLAIRRVLEGVYENYMGDKSTEDWKNLETYLKQIWMANGIHHHYSEDKIMPKFSKEYFVSVVKSVDPERMPFRDGTTADELLSTILPVMFDPDVMPKRVNQQPGVDLVKTSAVNFYEGVTQKQVEDFYNAMKDPNDSTPVSYGLNSKVVMKDGKVTEEVYKIGGLYGKAIERIVGWLEKAADVAENEQQKEVINTLIEYYRTGDLKKFAENIQPKPFQFAHLYARFHVHVGKRRLHCDTRFVVARLPHHVQVRIIVNTPLHVRIERRFVGHHQRKLHIGCHPHHIVIAKLQLYIRTQPRLPVQSVEQNKRSRIHQQVIFYTRRSVVKHPLHLTVHTPLAASVERPRHSRHRFQLAACRTFLARLATEFRRKMHKIDIPPVLVFFPLESIHSRTQLKHLQSLFFVVEKAILAKGIAVIIELRMQVRRLQIQSVSIEEMAILRSAFRIHEISRCRCRVRLLRILHVAVGRVVQHPHIQLIVLRIHQSVTQRPVHVGVISCIHEEMPPFRIERNRRHDTCRARNRNLKRRIRSSRPRSILHARFSRHRFGQRRQRTDFRRIFQRRVKLSFQLHLPSQQRILLLSQNTCGNHQPRRQREYISFHLQLDLLHFQFSLRNRSSIICRISASLPL
jgi:hypothetical protein